MAKSPIVPAEAEPHFVGTNIVSKVEGNILTLQIDLSQTHGPSASGKTLQVASSKGNVPIPDASDIMMGINIYRYAEKKTAAAKK